MRLEIESTTAAPPLADQIVSETERAKSVSEVQEFLKSGIKAAQNGDRAGARTALLKATELDPRNENAWLWLASISEYPEELLVFLNNVLDINPENARALEWRAATNALLAKTLIQRGIDAAEEGSNEKAADYFSKALEYDQHSAMAWMWLASLSESNEGKLLYLEKALAIEPENQEAIAAYRDARHSITAGHLAEAKAAAVAGRTSEAQDLLNAVLEEMPDSEDAWMLRSHFAESFDEKIRSFERVLEINPDNAAATASLESLRSLVGSAEQAVQAEDDSSPEPEIYEAAEAVSSEPELTTDAQEASPETTEQASAGEDLSFVSAEIARIRDEATEDKSPTQDLEIPDGVAEAFADARPAEAFETVEEPVEEMQAVPEMAEEPVYQEEPVFEEPWVTADPSAEAEAEPAESESFNPSLTTFISYSELYGNASEDPADAVEPGYENGSAEVMQSEEEVAVPVPDTALVEEAASEPANDAGEFDPFATMYSVPEISSIFDEAKLAAMSESPVGGDAEERSSDIFAAPANDPFSAEAPPVFESIPMPEADLELPAEAIVPTGFETTIVPPEGPTGTVSHCAFCNFGNEPQAFVCGNCLSVLSLSDLEMLLANSNADRVAVRKAVEEMELDRAARPMDESELTMLGIGYLNLQNLDAGHAVLLEASRLNPNNVVLSSQVNALHIRMEEIRQQQEIHSEMTVGKKILVVDDSPTIRKLISGKLEKSGHEVFCSADGVEAIERLQSLKPDLILLDITMPRMDGYQVCKMIRSNDATKDIPVVMISGKDGFFDKVRGRMAGTSGYIKKPFGPETLLKGVEGILKKRTAAGGEL